MKKLILSISFLILFIGFASTYAQNISYKTEENISYADMYDNQTEYMQERCVLDFYYPDNKEDYATVIWFHGGGLKGGNKWLPEEIKNKGYAVVAPNYRFYPKIKCPEYINDAAAAVAWVFKNIEKYGGDPDKIFISGHSAGGYLTSMVGLDKSYLEQFDVDANKIAGLIPFSGHTITHMTVREEMGINSKKPIIDKYAPLYHVKANCPPYIIITGGREVEMLGRYEENAYMYRMMKVNGHKETYIYEFDGLDHGQMVKPAYQILLKNIKQILEK